MPPGWGGGTGGRGGVGTGEGQGGGDRRGGGRGGGAKDVQSREELRKFLNFYRRKNSVCVDLYQPAFYSKKPNWEDMAEFVYSVLVNIYLLQLVKCLMISFKNLWAVIPLPSNYLVL